MGEVVMNYSRPPGAPPFLSPASGWSDPLTGADGPELFDRVAANEQARIERYGRELTVVVVEVVGLDACAATWGQDVAEGVFLAIAQLLRREVRTSDYLARTGPAQFRILLIETNEIAAINFVERARTACDAHADRARDFVHVGFGWASASPDRPLAATIDVAAERLASDLGLAES
jgi:diguanylate cyclase (GGDEF)-like protein